jgi:hypothetical protein
LAENSSLSGRPAVASESRVCICKPAVATDPLDQLAAKLRNCHCQLGAADEERERQPRGETRHN